MKKSLFIFLVLLLLVSGIAAAGFWQDVTGNIIKLLKKQNVPSAYSTEIIERADIGEPPTLPTMSDGLNLTRLPKIYPERYGTNYDRSGTYNVSIGDGFKKGDILVKILNFTAEAYPGDGNAGVAIEVFKRERDGKYYHMPTIGGRIKLRPESSFDLFGLTLELAEFSSQISPVNNTMIYHDNCTVYFDYCNTYYSRHYSPDPSICPERCKFEAFQVWSPVDSTWTPVETKLSDGKFTVVFPAGYEALAEYALGSLKQCYSNVTSFLGFEPYKPRVGLKVINTGGRRAAYSEEEAEIIYATRDMLDDNVRVLSYLENEMATIPCPYTFVFGHELTHMATIEMLKNYGLNEGLAVYVDSQLSGGTGNALMLPPNCFEHSFNYGQPYANLSSEHSDNPSVPGWSYYATGYCFWQDFINTYGHANFTKLMQEVYTRSHGVGKYYLLDVMRDVLGEPVSNEILERYSLTREATMINVCEGCEVYMPKYELKKPPVSSSTGLRASLKRILR